MFAFWGSLRSSRPSRGARVTRRALREPRRLSSAMGKSISHHPHALRTCDSRVPTDVQHSATRSSQVMAESLVQHAAAGRWRDVYSMLQQTGFSVDRGTVCAPSAKTTKQLLTPAPPWLLLSRTSRASRSSTTAWRRPTPTATTHLPWDFSSPRAQMRMLGLPPSRFACAMRPRCCRPPDTAQLRVRAGGYGIYMCAVRPPLTAPRPLCVCPAGSQANAKMKLATPLHLAAFHNRPEAVDALLHHGAIITAQTKVWMIRPQIISHYPERVCAQTVRSSSPEHYIPQRRASTHVYNLL